jgi:hypothetical protein
MTHIKPHLECPAEMFFSLTCPYNYGHALKHLSCWASKEEYLCFGGVEHRAAGAVLAALGLHLISGSHSPHYFPLLTARTRKLLGIPVLIVATNIFQVVTD